jgi:hypothetical protein
LKHSSQACLLALALVAAVSPGCGSRDKPVEPTGTLQYGLPSDAGAVTPTTVPPQPAAVDAAAPDLSALVSGALAQGAAILGTMGAAAGSDPVDNGLKSLGAQQAPGMKADGAATKLTLAPGAHGEASVTLRPGKCYTIVAFGNLGVQTLAIRLVYPPPMPAQPLFEGVSNGPTATIGAKDQCIRSPLSAATQLKLDIEMKAGQGQVGVQTYSK